MFISKGTCFYPGDFNPPTKGHLNEVLWLQTLPDVSQVTILLGEDRQGEIPQESKEKIWNIYLQAYPNRGINIQKMKPGEGSSFQYLIKMLDKTPDTTAFVALDDATARKESTNRTFQRFSNVEYQILKSSYLNASAKMRKAVEEDNDKMFMRLIPGMLSQSQIKEVKDLVKNKIEEEKPEENKEVISEKFYDLFGEFFKGKINLNENNDNSKYSEVVDIIMRDYPDLEDSFIRIGMYHDQIKEKIKKLEVKDQEFFSKEAQRSQNRFDEYIDFLYDILNKELLPEDKNRLVRDIVRDTIETFSSTNKMYQRIISDMEAPQDTDSKKMRTNLFLRKFGFIKEGEEQTDSILGFMLKKLIYKYKNKMK